MPSVLARSLYRLEKSLEYCDGPLRHVTEIIKAKFFRRNYRGSL